MTRPAGALAVAVAASLGLALACGHDPSAFLRAFVFAFFYWLALPLGALGLLMITHLTDARWGRLAQPRLEAMAATTGAMAVLAVALITARVFSPGASGASGAATLAPHKAVYLARPFLIARAVLFLASWLALAAGLVGRAAGRLPVRAISAAGLIVLGFSVTFATIDWQLSLEPAWFSTIYGLVILIGQALEAWAFTLLLVWPAGDDATLERDLGNILLTLIVLWAYLSFMQFLIIWSGNLPEEAAWYLARSRGGWQLVAAALALFQFAAPFTVLLFRGAKRRRRVVRALALCVLGARALEQYWLAAPAFSPARLSPRASELAAWCAVGAFWLWLYSRKENSRRRVEWMRREA